MIWEHQNSWKFWECLVCMGGGWRYKTPKCPFYLNACPHAIDTAVTHVCWELWHSVTLPEPVMTWKWRHKQLEDTVVVGCWWVLLRQCLYIYIYHYHTYIYIYTYNFIHTDILGISLIHTRRSDRKMDRCRSRSASRARFDPIPPK